MTKQDDSHDELTDHWDKEAFRDESDRGMVVIVYVAAALIVVGLALLMWVLI